MQPIVQVYSLGGTIAMTSSGDGPGVVPALTADALVAAVPDLERSARVQAASFRQLPGAHLTIDDLIDLAGAIKTAVAGGCHGVVITQGTDTIEETAFALDILLREEAPVVVTGAMRNPSLPGADGPANLLAAVQVAASSAARGRGVMVVLNDEIHAAFLVQKTHTTSPAAFKSKLAGPIGWVAEGRIRIPLRPGPRPHVPVGAGEQDAPVALITTGLGDDGRLLTTLPELGFRGAVIEGLGVGHVPERLVPRLEALAVAMPVILASRTGAGEILRATYGFPGSEFDLIKRGLIPAGLLDGPKARILLSLLLRAGADRAAIVATFEAFFGN